MLVPIQLIPFISFNYISSHSHRFATNDLSFGFLLSRSAFSVSSTPRQCEAAYKFAVIRFIISSGSLPTRSELSVVS